MKHFTLVFCLTLLLPLFVLAQLPNTNVYILDLRANEEIVLLNKPVLLSGFNPNGYNNQPHFTSNSELLITSDFESLGLTDILKLDLSRKVISRVTHTEESEYSPTGMLDQNHLSVVRQELDDSQPVPQTLWSYPLDRSHVGENLIPDHTDIGYHAWIDEEKVALFLVEDPSRLIIYDIGRKTSTYVGKNVGRCLKVDRDKNLYYIQNREDAGEIRKFDTYLGRSQKVISIKNDQRDFDLLPNGHLIIGDGAALKTSRPMIDSSWKTVVDLSSAGIVKITRIASTSGKVAIVTTDN